MFGRKAELRRMAAQIHVIHERMRFMAIDLMTLNDAVSKAVDTMAAAASKLEALATQAATAEANSVDPVAIQALADSLNLASDGLAQKAK